MTDVITGLLDGLNIQYRKEDHDPVFTVAEALAIHGDTTVKNLLLKEEKGDRLVFVVMRGITRLDVKSLASLTGLKKLQFAKSDLLKDTLGVEPGSVSLFSLIGRYNGRISVVIDRAILHSKEIGFHPNRNTSSIFIKGTDIPAFLEGIGVPYSTIDFV